MAVKKYYVMVDDRFGSTGWFKDAKYTVRHRENGPAIEFPNGHTEWWQDGMLHRVGGPATVFSNGDKRWYQHGKRHRTDGPAIEYPDGTKEWYINGEELTEAEFLAATQPVIEMTVADVEKLLGKRVKIIK